jgi:hypothetical protein
VAVACAVVVLGALVYVLERPGHAVPFFNAISVARLLASIFGPIGESLAILEQADSYLLSGTFDTRDLIPIAVGATAAHLVTAYTTPGDRHHG